MLYDSEKQLGSWTEPYCGLPAGEQYAYLKYMYIISSPGQVQPQRSL